MGYLRVTLPDGVGLSVYDRRDGSGTPLLFIHGNSCDHGFFAPQLDHFAPSRPVCAPDLRGHGESDKPDGDYAFSRLADDLAALLDSLGIPRCVAVGHSMGGMVAMELCARWPEKVAGVACLDSTLLTPPGRPSRMHSLLEGLKSPAWQGYFRRYFEAAFEPWDDPGRKAAILQRMLETPRHVVVRLFEQWRLSDGATAVRACRVPFLYVASSRPRTDVVQLGELSPQLMTGQVVGAGHFLTLEAPDQVNAMLERFFQINGL
ncbi:MAG: alpha/beta fold hydrolase [Thermodesulfobacteriota bacterium]